MYNKEDILNVANILGVTFNNFSLEDLITGVNIEFEHGFQNPITNITNNNLLLTMKIALAHLYEFPNYYNKKYGLPALEISLKNRRNY